MIKILAEKDNWWTLEGIDIHQKLEENGVEYTSFVRPTEPMLYRQTEDRIIIRIIDEESITMLKLMSE